MSTKIIPKKSTIAGKIPANLFLGEIAINYNDGILYGRHPDGSIVSLSGAMELHNHAISQVTGLQTELDSKENVSEKGEANGYASLDASGFVPESQIPSSISNNTVDSVNGYQGVVSLDTNDIDENTNLYYTDARARSSISVSGDLSYNNTTGVFSFSESYSNANQLLAAIKTVDGSGSGLDADTLDGLSSASFATSSQGSLASSALQSNDIGVSVQEFSTVLNNTSASFTTVEENKLADIEANATADQTQADINALNIDAGTLDNLDSSYFRDASNLNAGTVPDARLPASAFVDTTYSAGSGLTFTGNVINVDNPFNPSGNYASLRARGTTKDDVGLSVVDNTSDTDKPISTLQQIALNTKIDSSDRGIVNGVATLDSNAKVPLSQINDAILGQVAYNGTWNASTNTPTLPTTPNQKGEYYVVGTSGTFASTDFVTGDWIISNGSVWEKVDNTDSVSSVSGRTGNVVVNKSDVGLSNVRNVDAYSKTESNANYATDSQGTLADNAQPKESGKGLSSNDYTNTEKSKLTGIASSATNNDTNAQLRARSSHTGTQAVSTITGLADAATTTVSTIRAGTTKANVGLSDVDNYSRAHYDGRYLAINGKAADSNELDGLNSTQFVRSDQSDTLDGSYTVTGDLTVDGVANIYGNFINFITGTDARIEVDDSNDYGTGATFTFWGDGGSGNAKLKAEVYEGDKVKTLSTDYQNTARNEGVTVEYNESSKSLDYNFF
jgi:hypothetical protein